MFEPWLGSRYGGRENAFGGVCVMALGDSHPRAHQLNDADENEGRIRGEAGGWQDPLPTLEQRIAKFVADGGEIPPRPRSIQRCGPVRRPRSSGTIRDIA